MKRGVDTIRRLAFVVVATLALASHAQAQTRDLRGVVRDSASGQPIPGAVVLALDAVGTTLSRTLTNGRGEYRLQPPVATMLLRALRIGFRPTTERLPLVSANVLTMDLVLVTVPHALDAMLVTAEVTAGRGCPLRADRAEAYALLQQARAGLLATVIARERQPAVLHVLRFERKLDLDGVEVLRQTVRIDSSRNASTSFNAVRSATDFVEHGFRSGSFGEYTYFGPDADVLIDERFERGYCFSVAPADTARRSQVGLHFSAPNRSTGRVDIDGVLWVDTSARALRDIEFRYVGIEALAESFNAGGRVGFRILPNGVPFIDAWALRLVSGRESGVGIDGSVQAYAVQEIGGELARAEWPDGQTWLGQQGSIHFTAVSNDGESVKDARLNLAGTDYSVTTDRTGHGTINYVLPGPYDVVVNDSVLAPIGLQIPTGRTVRMQRGSAALVRVSIPTATQYVATLCNRPTLPLTETWLVGRVLSGDGKPAAGVHWRVSNSEGTRWRVVADNGITGSDGLVIQCHGLIRNSSAELAVWRDPKDAIRVQRTSADPLAVFRIHLPLLASIASAPKFTGTPTTTVTASGTVRDSATGAAIPDARVTFIGTPFEAVTDSSGKFVVGGLATGDYAVEVSSPALDSVGVVQRTMVMLQSQTAINLFLPTRAAIMVSACGTDDGTGFVAGNIFMPGTLQLPAGIRVVAEWTALSTDSASRSRADALPGERVVWRTAAASARGTYRVCGVPAGTSLVLHTESDSNTVWATPPRILAVPVERRFARVDLQLDSTMARTATLVGMVSGDSLGTPVENVEVTISDIARKVLTNARGEFRLSDIPPGAHLVSAKRVGYSPVILPLNFVGGAIVEQHLLLSRLSALATVAVEATREPKEFEERRASGVGRFLSRGDLEKQRGRRLGEVLTQVSGFGAASGGAGHMWVLGKRAPSHLLPRGGGASCGSVRPTQAGQPPPCTFTPDDLRDLGYYCPTSAERLQGITGCGCYAQVYVDGRLMNNTRPTEPFDANTLPVDDLEGVEFYGSAASTPGRYSSPNALCGVMLVWTRRR
ncbi:MAG: carboxypeptidase-like regulatory domain-containing protein [Gemmatimonadaceae bacterium]